MVINTKFSVKIYSTLSLSEAKSVILILKNNNFLVLSNFIGTACNYLILINSENLHWQLSFAQYPVADDFFMLCVVNLQNVGCGLREYVSSKPFTGW